MTRAALLGLASLLACTIGCETEQPGPTPWANDTTPQPVAMVAPKAPISGTWAILAYAMDATVVELGGDGTGHGCQAGWPMSSLPDSYSADFCGAVSGSVDGQKVYFDLELVAFGDPMHYAMDATASADGSRMAGVHHILGDGFNTHESGTAVRYDRMADPGPFPVGEPWPAEALKLWETSVYEPLVVVSDTVQGPFVPGKEYRLRKNWTSLTGDLGDFLRSELVFETSAPGELVLRAGPVQKTLEDRPVRLALTFTAARLAQAEVELPSGETYVLRGAP